MKGFDKLTKKYDSILLDIDNTITEIQPTLDLMANAFNREHVPAEEVLDFKLARVYNLTSEEEESFWSGYEIELAERSELAVERVKNMLDTYHNNLCSDDETTEVLRGYVQLVKIQQY